MLMRPLLRMRMRRSMHWVSGDDAAAGVVGERGPRGLVVGEGHLAHLVHEGTLDLSGPEVPQEPEAPQEPEDPQALRAIGVHVELLRRCLRKSIANGASGWSGMHVPSRVVLINIQKGAKEGESDQWQSTRRMEEPAVLASASR